MGYKHNKEDIISKGTELFRKKGYHNVGINEILKACNIPKGSFYNFFDTKEHFAEKVVEAYGSDSLNMVTQVLSDNTILPLERLKRFYTMIIDINEKDGFDSGCLINNLSIEVGGFNPDISRVTDKNFKILIEVISQCVKEGQDSGEIIDSIPAEDIAEYMHAGIFGAFSRMKVNKDRVYLDKWYRMTFSFISKT